MNTKKTDFSSNCGIDAVIAWVDGNDPQHRAKRMKLLRQGDTIAYRKEVGMGLHEESTQERQRGHTQALSDGHTQARQQENPKVLSGGSTLSRQPGHAQMLQEGKIQPVQQEAANEDPVLATRADDTRFMDNGELRFCIASIRSFAPWIRHIYLVTDNQLPRFLTETLCRDLGITIIDHTIIFKNQEWALPTFNTRTIECALWRIPGLSERFIYFNDDFVLASPVAPEDFFQDESVVLRGRWNHMIRYGKYRMMAERAANYVAKKVFGVTRTMHLLLQIRSARLAGFSGRFFRFNHVPHPLRKSVLERYFSEHPELFENNIRYRLRDTDQFSAIFLAHHLEIKGNRAVMEKDDDVLMIHGEMDPTFILERKIRKIKKNEVTFLCLQGLEKLGEKELHRIEKVLEKITSMDF